MTAFHRLVATCACVVVMCAPAQAAGISDARDLMQEGRFEEAHDLLWPAARSGNADAEYLIGSMHAIGLGTARDPARAFDWFLRAAMKGHPTAQSAVAHHFETGLGLPAPDLVRAFVWYQLSAIGGDPQAGQTAEDQVGKMTPEELDHAQQLVADYRAWLYPFQ